jgi:ABC-2 type transport system ATP-binding protein
MILKAENLSASENGNLVLDGVSFEIEEKGIYVILSKSEDERNALSKALAGILKLDGGSILYKDIELSDKKEGRALKAKIGYAPQKSFLYSDMTVYEALDFTGKMRGVPTDKRVRQIKEALEIVLLSQKGDVLIKALTPTESKRLHLANTLIGNPSTLIFNEPTANASAEDSELICDVLEMLGSKKTVLIFTEKISLANKLAKHIGIMSNGKMALWSTLENINEKLDGDPNALIKTFLAFSDDGAKGGKH